MIPVHINVAFRPSSREIAIMMEFGGKSYVETMTLEEWRRYVANLDAEPLRLGGYRVECKGDQETCVTAVHGIRDYLRKSDDDLRRLGI